MILCKKANPTSCVNLTNVVQVTMTQKIAAFSVGGSISIYGEVELLGKRVVSIRSCYGNITIDSNKDIEVKCTDTSNGKRSSCLGTVDCSTCGTTMGNVTFPDTSPWKIEYLYIDLSHELIYI